MTCGVAAAKRSERGTVSTHDAAWTRLTVSDRVAGDGGAGARTAASTHGGDVDRVDEGRAASWTQQQVLVVGSPGRGSARGTDSSRGVSPPGLDDRVGPSNVLRARRNTSSWPGARPRRRPGRPAPSGETLQCVEEKRFAGELHEGLRPRVVETGAEARGRESAPRADARSRNPSPREDCRFPSP